MYVDDIVCLGQDVRLLYGGKILQDGDPLSRILTQRPAPDCEVFTIHLSCSPAPAPRGTRTQEERGPGVSSPQQQWPGDGLYYTDVNQVVGNLVTANTGAHSALSCSWL